ncbi:MAG TPA: SWIM zinc finger family protein [Chthoniobacteraceae bacterium]|jgi:uncharacterized Zn finger protein
MSWGWNYQPYVSAAEKRRRAEKAAAKLAKSIGAKHQPIRLTGSNIAGSFWGKSWCTNLESYSDYSNRLPRGRTYVRNGAVLDLQIAAGKVTALVSGSELYEISIEISKIKAPSWKSLKAECAGRVGALIDLLQGKFAAPVMEIISRRDGGLFPQPKEIRFDCSCPDYAGMCKHIAATLYGIGARLDQSPELLFLLRGVDHFELVAEATESIDRTGASDAGDTLSAHALSDVFGIEIDAGDASPTGPAKAPAKKRRSQKAQKGAAKKKAAKPVARKLGKRSGKVESSDRKRPARKTKRSLRA